MAPNVDRRILTVNLELALGRNCGEGGRVCGDLALEGALGGQIYLFQVHMSAV